MNRNLLYLALAVAIVLILLFGTGAGAAERSPACREALAALQAAEDAALRAARADGAAAPAALEPLRNRAARACLGAGAGHPSSAQRRAQPPQAAAPVATAPRAAAPVAVAPPAALAAPLDALPHRDPPSVVTVCDALGCWTGDGAHLPRHGATQLLGPRGACDLRGALLLCP